MSLLYPQELAQPGSKAPPHKDLLKVQKGRGMQGMNAQLVLDKRNGDRPKERERERGEGGQGRGRRQPPHSEQIMPVTQGLFS